MKRWKVFVPGRVRSLGPVDERLRADGYELVMGPMAPPGTRMVFDPGDLRTLFGDVDAIVATTRETYTREVLVAASRARLVCSGVIGVENIDIRAATELGILVAYGAYPENFLGVSEATVMLIALLLKEVKFKEAWLRAGTWATDRYGQIVMGKTIGLIGLGRVGFGVVERLQGWGVRILAYDPYVAVDVLVKHGVQARDLNGLLEESDVVSVHATLTDETRALIGEAELRRMRPTAYLINTARGEVVDQDAVARAIQEGWIAGAALDAFNPEPLELESPLRALDPTKVVLTPHNIGFSREGLEASVQTVMENLARGLRGELPLYTRNPEGIPRWRERIARLEAARP